MISIDSNVWQNLATPSGERLVARPAFPDITMRFYCALDAHSHRHILIPLRPDNAEYHDTTSRGVSVVTRELVIHGQTANNYLDIECLDATGHSIFDLIGGEIVNEIQDETTQPKDVVMRVLAKWRRFWGTLPQNILSKNEQIGLFAELWFLTVWLIPQLGSNSVMGWRGPWGSRHDFEWLEKSVEVKATTNTRGRIFKIHGLNQLENPSQGPLFLFSMRLREEAGGINNLPILIENCRKQIAGSAEITDRFESALVQTGYSPFYEDEYKKLNLAVIEDSLFQVDDNFPRITSASFPAGMPSGVEQIEYEINLNTFDHLVIASDPRQLPFT